MQHRPTHNPTRPSAFTLVELMVSIAMVVLLMFGIHQVFRMTSNTIGSGQAINRMSGETRAAQSVMQEDFRRSMKDSPLFVISSQPVALEIEAPDGTIDQVWRSRLHADPRSWFHFTSRAEMERDADGRADSIDRDGDGSEETTFTATDLARVNDRVHRSDILGFFARGLFNRQTANDGLHVSLTKAYDAWIWYGHVKLPDPIAGGYWHPGVVPPANPNSENLFAANWVLGRRAILMKDWQSLEAAGEAYVGLGGGSSYYGPLAYNSPAILPGRSSAFADTYPAAGGSPQRVKLPPLRSTRLDVAGLTIENYRSELLTLRTGMASWWNPLVFRYECDPRVRKPITAASLAKTTPYFVGGVSQFIVEFAGDFLSQNNDVNAAGYGLVTGANPDGVIDFIVVDPSNETSTSTSTGNPRVRKTRWYGLPRDSNGDGFITGVMKNANAMPDVVPVWNVLRSFDNRAPYQPFEVYVPPPRDNANGYASIATPAGSFRYVCAWTDSSPAMVRVVMKLEDAAGRLADGQWVEFVLDAP